MKEHKAGFVNIIGKPNVGKSTLMNQLVGESLSIITPKAQTTRHRIMGMVNGEDFQIVYSDTPGVLEAKYKLQESMMKFVHSALKDADVLILVSEIHDKTENHEHIFKWIENSDIPLFVVLNKIDKMDQDKVVVKIEEWKARLPHAIVAPISALHGFNTDLLLERIIDNLPVSPPYFPKDELTDKTMRFFVSEIVRGKILTNYKQEVPYSCEVEVEEYIEEENIVRIRVVILCRTRFSKRNHDWPPRRHAQKSRHGSTKRHREIHQ